jgi:hypothetical protein
MVDATRISLASGDEAPLSTVEGQSRDGYRSLLATSRGLRRDQAMARDQWFAKLGVERKAELLFELEVILKGLACFANPRNHPGPPRHTAIVAIDFREPLLVARDGVHRSIAIARTLLGQEERAFIFQRYLEQVTPEDTARSKFLRATSSQETPEEALLALRHGFTHALDVLDALVKQPKVTFRAYFGILSMITREIGRNIYFNPIAALEFRPEFDRIKSREVLDLLGSVQGEEAHRLVALAFLALFRMIKYLDLVQAMASEASPGRAYLALAVLRSDVRALANHLRTHSGPQLSVGYERELFAASSRAVIARYEQMLAEGHRLLGIKAALEGIAAKLRLELRRAFERDIPPIESPPPSAELRKRLIPAAEALRPAIQSTIMFLTKALGARLDAHFVFDDLAAKREMGERLRRDVWMFAQIVRGFAAKAAVVRAPLQGERSDRWAGVESFRFVQEFLAYFRAMGYPLLRANDYPRFDEFMAAMSSLEETDLLDPSRLSTAVRECEVFYKFLMDLFESISKREELAGTPFDRKSAAESLKMYLSA